MHSSLKYQQLFLLYLRVLQLLTTQQINYKTTVATGTDVLLGVLAVHFFVFTENIIHSFLGKRKGVWAPV